MPKRAAPPDTPDYSTIRKASEQLLEAKRKEFGEVGDRREEIANEDNALAVREDALHKEVENLGDLVRTARELDPDFDESVVPDDPEPAAGRGGGDGKGAPGGEEGSPPPPARPPSKPKAAKPKSQSREAAAIAREALRQKAFDWIAENPGQNGRAIAVGIGLGTGGPAETKVSALLRELQADRIHAKPNGKGKAWFVNGESKSSGIETPPAPPTDPPGVLSDQQLKVLDAVISGRGNPAKTPAEVARITNMALVQIGPILEALTGQGYLQRGRPDSGPAVYAPGKRTFKH